MSKIQQQLPLGQLELQLKPDQVVGMGSLVDAPRVWSGRKRKNLPTKQEIISKCRLNKMTGCWEWSGAKSRTSKKGYGQVRRGQKLIYLHVQSYRLWKGKIPSGLWVLHKCDNPTCCNPRHLFLGTQLDNWMDCLRKGRTYPQSLQLPAHKVLMVRSDSRPQRTIALYFGISQSYVSKIKRRLSHADI